MYDFHKTKNPASQVEKQLDKPDFPFLWVVKPLYEKGATPTFIYLGIPK